MADREPGSIRVVSGGRSEATFELPRGFVPNGYSDGTNPVSVHIDADTVGENAFKDCKDLVSVTFSTRIKYIGEEAFAGCSKLKEVKFEQLPNQFGRWGGVEVSFSVSVGNDGIPLDGDRYFNGGCFKNCTGLKSFEIPQNARWFGSLTFQGCTSLKTITVWKFTAIRLIRINAADGRVIHDWGDILRGANVETINCLGPDPSVLRWIGRVDPDDDVRASQLDVADKERLEVEFFNGVANIASPGWTSRVGDGHHPVHPFWTSYRAARNGIFTTTVNGKVVVPPKLMEVRYWYVDFEGNRVLARTGAGEPVVFKRNPTLRREARFWRAEQLARAGGPRSGWRPEDPEKYLNPTGPEDQSEPSLVGSGLPSLPTELWDHILGVATDGTLYDWTAGTGPDQPPTPQARR